jgi:type II secretory pathway pseudopilin PulG
MLHFSRSRPALTLIELMLFLALTSMVSVAVLTFFLSTQESSVRQKALLDLEANGTRIIQTFLYEVRHAERILDPAPGATGSILTLQMTNLEVDPTIIARFGSGMVLIEASTLFEPLDPWVEIEQLTFRNTSATPERPSVSLEAVLSIDPDYPTAPTFRRQFSAVATAFPDDLTEGNPCGCGSASCALANDYRWNICPAGTCVTLTGALRCP